MTELSNVVNENADEIDEISEKAVDDNHDNVLQKEAKQAKVSNIKTARATKSKNNKKVRADSEEEKFKLSLAKAEFKHWIAMSALGGFAGENICNAEIEIDGEPKIKGLKPWLPLVWQIAEDSENDVTFFLVISAEKRILNTISERKIKRHLKSQSVRACHMQNGTPLGMTLGALGHFSIYDANECMDDLKTYAADPEPYDLRKPITEPILAIACADDPGWAFVRMPFDRPKGQTPLKSMEIDYSRLGPYFRGILSRMDDYNEDTDQSRMFESLLECTAMTFLQSNGTKVVPFLYGPPGAAKTSYVEDLGSLIGMRAFAPDQKLSEITSPYYKSKLEGKRLVHVDEAPKGDQLSEDFKALTGGSDYFLVRNPHEQPKTIRNTAMIWITSNHPPLFAKDEAAQVRFRMIGIKKLAAVAPVFHDKEARRRLLEEEIADALEIGASLLAQNDGIARESAAEHIAERLDDELDIIVHQIDKYFQLMKGSLLPVAEIKLWAQSKRHNFKRVETVILNMTNKDGLRVEKIKSNEGTRRWCYRNIEAKRFIEVLSQHTY